MNHFDVQDGVMHAEGVSLADIAEAVGTPVYVYSAATLERHYQVFADAFADRPDTLIAYAVKANSNLAVIETLARLGAGADTVSEGEIRRALAAGVPASRIVFSGVGKSDDELRFAISAGVHQINVESPPELDRLSALATAMGRTAGVAVRVNPDVAAGGHAKISTGGAGSKFGVGFEAAAALYARACGLPGIRAEGLACHIGSQITTLQPLEAAFVKMRGLAESLNAAGFRVHSLDLGGGLGVPYHGQTDLPTPADYAAMVKRVLDGLDVRLGFEPGRLIAGNAGVLVSRVIRIHDRSDRRFVILDAAMNDLIRPALYDAFHDVRPVRAAPVDAPRAPADIVGPVCETGDTFAVDRPLPPLEEGDLVAFMTAGAYGAVMSSTYNTRPLVPEVMVNGTRWAVVRPRPSYAEMFAAEQRPDWFDAPASDRAAE